MGLFEICFIGVGLAMDAFAVAVCKGLLMKKFDKEKSFIISMYFGTFQALMPLIGYILGSRFKNFVVDIDHWIAFILLAVLGGKMIKESFGITEEKNNDNIDYKTMLILSIATSIDALAVGITFSFFKINILYSISIIGIITFILSFIGVKIGNKFGDRFQNIAELMGGVILILIGTKILLEHLGILV